MTAMNPANLRRRLSDGQDYARQSGDRAAWADLRTSLVDCQAYEAAWIGVPLEYVDPSTGRWSVPESTCWSCWTPIEGPVAVMAVNAECRHHHVACLTDVDLGQLYEGRHGLRSCPSRLPHYGGGR